MVMTGPLLVVGLISAVASGVAAAPFFDLSDDLLSDIFYWDYDSEESTSSDCRPENGSDGYGGSGGVINNGVVVTINGAPGGPPSLNNIPTTKPTGGSGSGSTSNTVAIIMNGATGETVATATMTSNNVVSAVTSMSTPVGRTTPGAKG